MVAQFSEWCFHRCQNSVHRLPISITVARACDNGNLGEIFRIYNKSVDHSSTEALKALRKAISRIEIQMTNSAKLILFSVMSLIAAQILGFGVFEHWRDGVAGTFVGVISYLTLQLLTWMRYGNRNDE